MPKINFNTPFINENGDQVMQAKVDVKKAKLSPQGVQIPHIVTNEDGTVVQDAVLVKDMLVKILTLNFENDDKISFGDRAKRGKLARKIMTSSTANYTVPQLTIIQELSAKAGSTTLLAQLDDLINGSGDGEEETSSQDNSADKAA
jgi:hypothetical protein